MSPIRGALFHVADAVAQEIETLAVAVSQGHYTFTELRNHLAGQRHRWRRLLCDACPSAYTMLKDVMTFLHVMQRTRLTSTQATPQVADELMGIVLELRGESEAVRKLGDRLRDLGKRTTPLFAHMALLPAGDAPGPVSTVSAGTRGAAPQAAPAKKETKKRSPGSLTAKQFTRLKKYVSSLFKGQADLKDECWICALAGRRRGSDTHKDYECPSADAAHAKIPADFTA